MDFIPPVTTGVFRQDPEWQERYGGKLGEDALDLALPLLVNSEG